ncbi:MAG: GLPGLI family protein, partial [Bacteroidetes bacterium]|nr:GLPGLI family protein [Bacteroidota bacterium]
MKKTLLTIGLFIAFFTNAQIKSGIIKYEMITSLAGTTNASDKEIPEAILAMIPKEIKKNKILRFNETKALYENFIPNKESNKEEEEPQDGSGGMQFKFKSISSGDGAKEKTLTNLALNKQKEYKEFFGKDFIITTDSIKKTQWKPTRTQKLVLKYPCYEAITIGEVRGKQDTIKAWYTPSISSKAGPMGYCNLPGMILQLEMGGKITITATEVIEQEVKDNELEIPSGGKKVTAAE